MLPSDLDLPPKFLSYRSEVGQEESILSIAGSSKRFSLLSAPTGSGKTLIGLSVSKLLSLRTLYLVVSKSLQNQVYSDFSCSGLIDIRGHSNYSCSSVSFDDDGEIADFDCLNRINGSDCLYLNQVEEVKKSDLVCSNYAHWVQLEKSDDPNRLGEFDFLVVDEAHLVDLLLSDLISVKLFRSSLSKLLGIGFPEPSNDLSDWKDWCRSVRNIAEATYEDLRPKRDEIVDYSTLRTLIKLNRIIRDISRFLSESKIRPWIIQQQNPKFVQFAPVWSRYYTEQYLFRSIPKILLVSATLSPDTGKYLGIPKSESEYSEIYSSFSPANRPFIFIPTTRVDYRMSEGDMRILVNRIDSIIEDRLDRKGIIHTRSYLRAKEILSRSRFAPFMISHNSYNTKESLERFRQSTYPSIFVSPAVEEGHSFDFDLCRYQIIIKVPFLDSRTPLVKARSLDDKDYSNFETAQSIIQMSGRAVRSSDDIAETFILDKHWAWFRNKSKSKFPFWFRRAWITTDRIPTPIPLDQA